MFTVTDAAAIVSWLCTAPFGRPVVPDVYMMKSRSSPAARVSGSASEAAAATAS